MKTLSLKLPRSLDARLAAVARRRHASKSEVVRNALAAYLTRKDGAGPGTFLDLAKDLAGCISGGSPDLSYSKTHMREFGR